nr:MAG TPA: hypothetical protein [Caudoviricetes sp.]
MLLLRMRRRSPLAPSAPTVLMLMLMLMLVLPRLRTPLPTSPPRMRVSRLSSVSRRLRHAPLRLSVSLRLLRSALSSVCPRSSLLVCRVRPRLRLRRTRMRSWTLSRSSRLPSPPRTTRMTPRRRLLWTVTDVSRLVPVSPTRTLILWTLSGPGCSVAEAPVSGIDSLRIRQDG